MSDHACTGVRPGARVRGGTPSIRLVSRATTERGATSVEYALTTLAVVLALFVLPVDAEDGRSAVALLLDAVRQFQQNTTYLLSLP